MKLGATLGRTAGVLLALALTNGDPSVSPAVRAAPGGVVRIEHRDPTALPSRGPTNALVTIELFYTPGPSSRHQSVGYIEKLQRNHPSRIRIVYRLVKGSSARLHYASLHAYAEGKFFEFIEAINAAPRALDDKALLELAKKVGLDTERLLAAITRPPAAYDAVLEANERRRKQKIRTNMSLPSALFNGKPPAGQVSSLTLNDFEREYLAARELAEELIDQGVDPRRLAEAYDQVVTLPDEIVVQTGPTDEDVDDTDVPSEPLLKQPLQYRGLPSHGPGEGALTIAVLCSPTSTNCDMPLSTAQRVADVFPDRVRVVWGPYYDVAREDAADLSILADAALCAERDGGRSVDRDDMWDPKDSPGWRWVREIISQSRSRSRSLTTDQRIDRVVDKLLVERNAFATCRAKIAGTSIAWIEAARRAGVRTTPATIVNGRVYGPINDAATLQLLVEAELAPGILAPSWTRR